MMTTSAMTTKSLALVGGGVLLALLVGASLGPLAAQRPKCMGETATIVGSGRSERILGTNEMDVIVGRGGADYILGKGSADLICGGSGRDHIEADAGEDRIKAGGGDDTLLGGSRTVALKGGGGDDVLFPHGGLGGRLDGGAGSDWLTFVDRGCKRGVRVDLLNRSATYRTCKGELDRVWVVLRVENVEGSVGNDSLTGGDGSNRLLGHESGDQIRGRAGNDRLLGGTQFDRGWGGPDRDTCVAVERARSC